MIVPGVGFAVTVKHDCPHIGPLAALREPPTLDEAQAMLAAPCARCEDPSENWVSVASGKIMCSRYVNSHMLEHAEATGKASREAAAPGPEGVGDGTKPADGSPATVHECVAISFSDLSVWCFQCDAYCASEQTQRWLRVLHDVKFGRPAGAADGPAGLETEEPPATAPASASSAAAGRVSSHDGTVADDKPAGDDDPHPDSSTPLPLLRAAMREERLDAIAADILEGRVRRILVLAGAGLSVSAGIPDFRSSSGLYNNLAASGLDASELDEPEDVFNIDFFKENPRPFFMVQAMMFKSSGARPTPSHHFLALLNRKGLLRRVFTQNIDGLEFDAGIDHDRVVQCHGGSRTAHCVACGESVDPAVVEAASAATVASAAGGSKPDVHIPRCPHCTDGVVKPDITFFGENLPRAFFDRLERDVVSCRPEGASGPGTLAVDDGPCDLIIIMGTSLRVMPVAMIPSSHPDKSVPRLLLNMEAVGDVGDRSRDAVVLGDLDGSVRALADKLGWRGELEALVAAAASSASGAAEA